MRSKQQELVLPAVRAIQGTNVPVYSFFLPGSQVLKIASISRVYRDEHEELQGFQRKEIRHHVRAITEFLDQGAVLFPNAIILSISSEVEFIRARGRRSKDSIEDATIGRLRIPLRPDGQPIAWIVDGQQRALALSATTNTDLLVPVVAFVSEDVNVQREQFVLVNKARPLPSRLINELLPEVFTYIPRDLAPRKIPSELCNLLNQDNNSPFHNLIRRSSNQSQEGAVVVDTALINLMRRSIRHPLGALSPFKTGESGQPDVSQMYKTMVFFWSVVKEVFPDAWGKPPVESRLMHSAGLEAMGYLMDRIMSRAYGQRDMQNEVHNSLARIAPNCAWTQGIWEPAGLQWNEIQNTPRHIRTLADLLIQYDYWGCRTE
jgi:DGQHR domain-containing protein